MFDIKSKLKLVLESSKLNHTTEILKQNTIKDVHIYCKIFNLPGQISGALIEKYIKNKYIMQKNHPSLCIGDLFYRQKNIEIKISNGGKKHNRFNFVQIRLNHDCDYLLSTYYIDNDNLSELGEWFMFKIDKNSMKTLILKYGSYAYGTTQKLGKIAIEDLEDLNNNKEYAIRPKYGDECWKTLLKFRIFEKDL